MPPSSRLALLAAGVACLGLVTGCTQAHPRASAPVGLRLVDLPVVAGGDEHDEIGASDDGRWWVVARYPSNRVVRVHLTTGAVTGQPGLRRATGAPYAITDAGRVRAPYRVPAHADLLVDQNVRGQLLVTGHTVSVSTRAGRLARAVAGGYPRLEVEQEASFSNGALSSDGRTVTVPTDRGYDPRDRDHQVDVYQLDLRSGRFTWVSRTARFGGHGVAASPDGRFVVFDGSPRHSSAGSAADLPVRWDRVTGRASVVAPAATTRSRHGLTGQLSVTDDGSVAFVADDCDLTSQRPPRGAQACLYVSSPARR